MKVVGLCLFSLLAALTLTAAALDTFQNDWSAGDGAPGPVDHWGRKFDTETNIDYDGTPGEFSLTFPETEALIEKILEHPLCVIAAKIDADDDMDVVVCSMDYNMVNWFDNLDGEGKSWDFQNLVWSGAQCLYPADVDNDADNDIFIATSGSVVWRANDGTGGGWSSHSVGSASGVSSLFSADMDGDDDADIVAAIGSSGEVTWWSNDDGVGGSWTSHSVATGFTGASEVCAADVDGDTDLDVIASGDGSVTWWSNDDGAGTSWTAHLVYTDQDISSVAAADIDGDTDIDLAVTCHTGNRLVWFSNDDGVGGAWTLNVLQEDFTGAESVKIADLDGDLDMDVAAAAGGAGVVAWWENTAGDGSAFTEHVLSEEQAGANCVCVGDINGDGVDDVICSALDTSETRWWNTAPPEPVGSLVSSILDTSADTEWGWAVWDADAPDGTDVTFSVRASDDTGAMGTWADLVWGADLGDVLPTVQDYFQYQVTLSTLDLQVSPTFSSLTISPYFHLVSPADGSVLETLMVTLDWDDTVIPDFDTYTLWWGKDPTFDTYTEVAGLTESTFTINLGLADGDVIYWRVKALDSSANEFWAPEQDWSFTIDMGVGVELAYLDVRSEDEGVLVDWSFDGETPAGVRVLREVDGELTPLHHDALPGSAARFLDRDIEPDVEYRYWLEVVTSDGVTCRFGPSDVVSISEEAPELVLYAAYPNPSREVINFVFSLPDDGRAALSVYDLAGRRVATPLDSELTAGRHETTWNCGDVPSGVYLYRLETTAGSLTQRLVISR